MALNQTTFSPLDEGALIKKLLFYEHYIPRGSGRILSFKCFRWKITKCTYWSKVHAMPQTEISLMWKAKLIMSISNKVREFGKHFNEETHVERPFFPAMKWKLQKNFTQWEECKSEPKSNTVTKDSDHQARVSCQFLFPQNSYFCYWTKQICLIWQCHAKLIACGTLSLHTVRNKNSSKQKVSFKLNVCRGLCKTHDRATWYQFEGQLSQS